MSATAFQRKRREAAARAAHEATEASAKKTEAGGDRTPIEKMNKAELIVLATELQLVTKGTITELRERIKAAQEAAAKDDQGGGGGGPNGDQS